MTIMLLGRLVIGFNSCQRIGFKQIARNQSKLSYCIGKSSEALRSETIADVLKKAAAVNPDRLAVISQHQKLEKTYKQLDADVSNMKIYSKCTKSPYNVTRRTD